MGNKDVGQITLFLQLYQKVEYLRLNGNVQCRDRLIADHHLRIDAQCTGNANTLTLTARELMGIAIHVLPAHIDRFQQIADDFALLLLVLDTVMAQRISKRLENRKGWIQR